MPAGDPIRSVWIAAIAALAILPGSATQAETAPGTERRSGSSPAVLDESQVKAAFLYNFVKFIEWPPGMFTDAHSPYVIGVLGRNAVSTYLQDLVRERIVNGRPILIRVIDGADQAVGVHLLFVGAGEEGGFAVLQPRLSDAPIVVVGESVDFIRSGGTIGFVLQDAKVRFEIRIDVAERAGVRISAQLQKLATAVRRGA
jgi:hypothetical protein